MSARMIVALIFTIFPLSLAGCGDNNCSDCPPAATETPVAADTPASTATTAPTQVPTDTAAPTDTPVPTDTPAPTEEPTDHITQPPTATPTAAPGSIADELAAAGLDRYLGLDSAAMTQNGDWEEYTYDPTEEKAICLRGTPYQVNLRRGTVNKVLLYLEGGGACWNFGNCWQSPLAKLEAGPASGAGILNASNPDNPFRDWNVVYASYCDGSVFAGDNIADYDGNPTYHHGLQNLSAAVTLMRREFPDPELIFVSGSSAGGYGTLTGYGVTRVAYPNTPILVFDDSGPGLQNTGDPDAEAEREANWKFTDFIPASCTDCAEQFTYLTDWSLERDPTLRVAYFNYLKDPVLQLFLNVDAEGFEALLLQVTSNIHDRFPDRFKRFFPEGNSHTVLELPSFYSKAIDDTTVRDWTADFLADGPAWRDMLEAANPYPGFESEQYAADSMWLCKPDMAENQCFVNDIDATAVLPDNSLRVDAYQAAEDPAYDCFYVYPTVDLSFTPGNHTDFSDIGPMLDPLLSQAARFTGLCRVFAPLYRQVTIGTYFTPGNDDLFDIAYGDVRKAFRHYMGQYNNGRDFVIMGHSQGTGMTMRLLQEEIDDNPALRSRLIAALLIGGGVEVPEGETVGGTFRHIPLCTSVEETGCAIAYRTYAEGLPPQGGSNGSAAGGMDAACTNPAAPAGGEGHFRGSYFPLFTHQTAFNVGISPSLPIETPFALYENFYAGECVKDAENRSYLEIRVRPGDGDLRENEVPFDHPLFDPSLLGTHILDYNFPLGDLLDLVRAKAAAR